MFFSVGETGRIWPNMSILLVGPSGHGKDTIINPSVQVLRSLGGYQVEGTTIEAVKESLSRMGNPAVGFINASELADFLGCKDYQAGLVQSLTNILSSGDKVDISLKSDIVKGFAKYIMNPTLTMFAGSTAEWLQGMLPEGSLDGGFIPRFVVAPEFSKKSANIHPIANPAKYDTPELALDVKVAKQAFVDQLRETMKKFTTPRQFIETNGTDNAEGWYENWYGNRYRTFTPLLQSYAHRSSGLMRRLGMLMAISRGSMNSISEEDYYFADQVIQHAAERLEQTVIPMSREVRVGHEILAILPVRGAEILRALAGKYSSLWVKRAILYLQESEQIVVTKEGMYMKNNSKEENVSTNSTNE